MNKRTEPYGSPDDRDIGALFDAQNINLPKDLDQQILSHARHAAESDRQKMPSKGSAFRPWFAAAAAGAMIAIGIAPQLIRSPESSLNTASESTLAPTDPQNYSRPTPRFQKTSKDAATTAESVTKPESIARTVASTPPRTDNNVGGAAGDVAGEVLSADVAEESVRDNAREVDRDNMDEMTGNQSGITLMPIQLDSGLSGFTTTVQSSKLIAAQYRHEPNAWIQQMRRLEAQDMLAAAAFEYDQFREKFPNYVTDFRPQVRDRN